MYGIIAICKGIAYLIQMITKPKKSDFDIIWERNLAYHRKMQEENRLLRQRIHGKNR